MSTIDATPPCDDQLPLEVLEISLNGAVNITGLTQTQAGRDLESLTEVISAAIPAASGVSEDQAEASENTPTVPTERTELAENAGDLLVDLLSDVAGLARGMDAIRFRTAAALVQATRFSETRAGKNADPRTPFMALPKTLGCTSVVDLLAKLFGIGVFHARELITLAEHDQATRQCTAATREATGSPLAAALAAGTAGAERIGSILRQLPDPAKLDAEQQPRGGIGSPLRLAAETALARLASGTFTDVTAHTATAFRLAHDPDSDLEPDDTFPGDEDPVPAAVTAGMPVHFLTPLPTERLRAEAKAWAALLDPPTRRSTAAKHRKRSLKLSPTADGGFRITGYAPAVEGAIIDAALTSATNPRGTKVRQDVLTALGLTDAEDTHDGQQDLDSDPAVLGEPQLPGRPVKTDDRTPDQSRFDLLATWARRHLTGAAPGTPTDTGTRVVITCSLEALQNHQRTAETPTAASDPDPEGSQPMESVDARLQRLFDVFGEEGTARLLTDARFAHLSRGGFHLGIDEIATSLCNSRLELLTTDESGQPLRLSRTHRLFSSAQLRTLAARDRRCRAPGCNRTPDACEGHHVRHWAHDGATDIDNGLLLCAHHHHQVHAGHLVVLACEPNAAQPTPYVVLPRNTGRRRTSRRQRSQARARSNSHHSEVIETAPGQIRH